MSVELFFPTKRNQERLRGGPLSRDIDGFAAWVAAHGYAQRTAKEKLCSVSSFSRWLEDEGLGIDDLDELRFEAFLRSGRAHSRTSKVATTGRQLLSYLRENRRIPAAPIEPENITSICQIERTYTHFLVNERGLSSGTVRNNVRIVRAFLADRFGTRPVAVKELVAQDANQYILRRSQRFGRAHTQDVASALRGFLRHLFQRGDITADLAGAVVPTLNWRQAGLPKALSPDQVELLLESCNRKTVVGRRDYAILLLLARLGLRGGEVAVMTLEDLNWSNGIVNVSGKSQRREALPLPQDVGDAMVAYLRDGRPSCSTRRVFVRIQAPHRGFSSSCAVSDIVRRSFARAGIDPPFKGAHVLRHTLATGMLRNGASLDDIGQILRHRNPETTQIYAKLDSASLRTLAPAWLGGAS